MKKLALYVGLTALAGIIIVQQFLLIKKTNQIMATQAQAAQELVAFKEQLSKVNGEIQAKIQTLIDAAANKDVDPELQSAIDDLSAPIQALDDIVPDAATPTDGGTTTGDVPAA